MNPYHEPLLLSLSLIVMLCWFYFGSKAGVLAFIASVLLILWTTLHYTFYLYGLHILLLLSITLITNHFVVKEETLKQIKDMSMQELTEKKNSLEVKLRDYRVKTPALERKLYPRLLPYILHQQRLPSYPCPLPSSLPFRKMAPAAPVASLPSLYILPPLIYERL